LGPGRGLEDLILALPLIQYPAEVHLRGTPSGSFRARLEAKIPPGWKEKIFFHSPVHNTELLERIAEHDIGFAGERPDSLNKNLTVSNKIFHYMLGGLAVAASNTDGQKEIAATVGSAMSVYDAGNPTALAEKLNALLSSQTRLEAAKADSLSFAREQYCWEIDKSKLLTLVEKSLQSSH
jgi:hypothetical protein